MAQIEARQAHRVESKDARDRWRLTPASGPRAGCPVWADVPKAALDYWCTPLTQEVAPYRQIMPAQSAWLRAEREPGRIRETAERFHGIWHERNGRKGARKLLDATLCTAEGTRLTPSRWEATAFVEDEPRRQVYTKPHQEWSGVAQMGGEEDQILSVDTLDTWSARCARTLDQDG